MSLKKREFTPESGNVDTYDVHKDKSREQTQPKTWSHMRTNSILLTDLTCLIGYLRSGTKAASLVTCYMLPC